MEKPIYLTTKRLLYNVARIEFDKGRISQEELNKAKFNWEVEYNDKNIQEKLQKKYSK
jgi:hypothetical protein